MATARDEIVPKLVQVFRRYGYEGTTLSRIAKATELGRASLYHHFPGGKQEMAEAVLAHVNQIFAAIILEPLKRNNPPEERLRLMAEGLGQFYDRGNHVCLLGIFSLGEAGEMFDQQVKPALNAWLDSLAQVFIDAGCDQDRAQQEAETILIEVQGGLLVAQALGSTAPFERILNQIPLKSKRVPKP